ncbi:MAG: GDP-L-fucose synthase family protein [Bacteriovoracaceae bacterium]
MNKDSAILILGSRGLVGSAITTELKAKGYTNLLTPVRPDLDLQNQQAVLDYYSQKKPEYVFLAAAKVGGILANNTYRADFLFENLQIQNNVFGASFKHNVKKLLFLGSSCIYPKACPQPMKEEYLLTSKLEETNEPYAIAKIAGLKLAENFRRQYGVNYISVMPTNLYGLNDNFDLKNSHVIPGLIARLQKHMDEGKDHFEVWGTGKPKREFLYVDDMARACVFVMEYQKESPDWMNIGTGTDISIGELSTLIAHKMGFQGKISFNTEYPDGTIQKLLDISKIKSLGWSPEVQLEDGLERVIKHYRSTYKNQNGKQ